MSKSLTGIAIAAALMIFWSGRTNAEDLKNPPAIDPTIFQGMPLKSYPNLFFVKSTKYFNFFWSANTACADGATPETVVDQRKVQIVNGLLETEVEPLIDLFEKRTESVFPDWKAKISNRLFPIDVHIEMLASGMCDGADVGRNIVVYDAKGNEVGTRENHPTISAGGTFTDPEELKAIKSITMHELGHLILRTIGYPKYLATNGDIGYGPLEEAYADFVALIGTNGSPLVGEGLGKLIEKEYCSKLGSITDPFQKLRTEANCLPIAQNAMRNLSLPLMYPNLYKLPEFHNIAAHLNALMYRLTRVVGITNIFKEFTALFLNGDRSIYDSEIDKPVRRVLDRLIARFPSRKKAINSVENSLQWKTAVTSSAKLEVGQTKTTSEGLEIDLSTSSEIKADLFANEGVEVVSIIISDSKGPVFSYPNIPLLWHPVLQLTSDKDCGPARIDCICGNETALMSVVAVYLNKNMVVSRTAAQKISMSPLSGSSCYRIGSGEHR